MKKVEIITGDIGSVRNMLTKLMNENVHEIISLTQSQFEDTLTIVLIYREKASCPEEYAYKPLD